MSCKTLLFQMGSAVLGSKFAPLLGAAVEHRRCALSCTSHAVTTGVSEAVRTSGRQHTPPGRDMPRRTEIQPRDDSGREPRAPNADADADAGGDERDGRRRPSFAEEERVSGNLQDVRKRRNGSQYLDNPYYNRILLYQGPEALADKFKNKYETIGIVAALIATMVVPYVTHPEESIARSNDSLAIVYSQTMHLAFLFCVFSVLVSTFMHQHLSLLMATPDDVVWFANFHGIWLDMPDLLIVLAVITSGVAYCIHLFYVYNRPAAYGMMLTSMSCGVVLISYFFLSLCAANKRGRDANANDGLFRVTKPMCAQSVWIAIKSLLGVSLIVGHFVAVYFVITHFRTLEG